MSLEPDQTVALSLAGTVALPSPYPACGPVDIVVEEVGGEVVGVFLKVTHRANRRLKIARIVPIDHVRVILAAKSLAPEGYPSAAEEPEVKGEWVATTLFPLQVRVRHLIEVAVERRRKNRDKDDRLPPLDPIRLVDEAILYVTESAPVLMEVEVSLTAAESANYYPPMTAGESQGIGHWPFTPCDSEGKSFPKKLHCDSDDKSW
jgi:hypothetical protein